MPRNLASWRLLPSDLAVSVLKFGIVMAACLESAGHTLMFETSGCAPDERLMSRHDYGKKHSMTFWPTSMRAGLRQKMRYIIRFSLEQPVSEPRRGGTRSGSMLR